MVKRLVQHGNSYALIIDKPIMKMLGITPETALKISTDGKKISVEPQESKQVSKKKISEKTSLREKKIKAIYKNIATRYKKDLQKLAKT